MATNPNKVGDVLERAVATYVQSAVGLLATGASGVAGVDDLSVATILAVSAAAAVLSVVKSLAAITLPFGDQSASLLRVGYETITRVIERVEVPTPVKRKAPAKKAAPKK